MSPQSQSGLSLFETFDLISNTTILGVLYGIVFTLYCLCARLLYLQLQEPDKRQQAKFTLAYTSLILFCATTSLALSARVCQLAFIKHPDYPGGPVEYLSSKRTAICIVDLTVEVLTMAIQIWRLWIVWSGTQYAITVTIPPLLYLFTCIGLNTFTGIEVNFLSHEEFGISSGRFNAVSTAGYVVLSTFTILVTGLVAARLLLVRRRHIRILGTSDTSSPYMSIIAILTESYALESIWSTATAISIGVGSPSVPLFMNNDSTIKVIAYLLIIYRVAVGRGWTKETEQQLTSLQWNRSAHTTTDEVSGVQSRVPAPTTVVVMGSPPMSHSESVV